MPMEIKAIETEYNGYKFRSRLEARWAVFFDELGVEYEYEPEGFDLGNGLYYLPDFRVKCWGMKGLPLFKKPVDLWVEVKGVMTEYDAKKIKKFADSNNVLVVSNIPNPDSTDYLGSFRSDEEMNGTDIYPWNYELIMDDYYPCYPATTDDGKFYLDGADYQTMDRNIICQALRAARQARFEHGECGYQKRTFIPKDAVRVYPKKTTATKKNTNKSRVRGKARKRCGKSLEQREREFEEYLKSFISDSIPDDEKCLYKNITWARFEILANLIFSNSEEVQEKIWRKEILEKVNEARARTNNAMSFQCAISNLLRQENIPNVTKNLFISAAKHVEIGADFGTPFLSFCGRDLRDIYDNEEIRGACYVLDRLDWLTIPTFALSTKIIKGDK